MNIEPGCLIETGSALVLHKQMWKCCSFRIDWDLQEWAVTPVTSSGAVKALQEEMWDQAKNLCVGCVKQFQLSLLWKHGNLWLRVDPMKWPHAH